MGIDASKSADRNRSSIKLRRNDFRTLLCENLERRDLMAVDGPRLLSIAPNSGGIFSTTSANSLNESPRELVFRFDASINPTTINNGIRITRAGGDGVFGTSSPSMDVVVPPSYLNFSDPANQRVIVARFSQPLLDDLYRVEIFGVNFASPVTTAIRDTSGLVLKPRRAGTDRDTYDFNLELGTKIVSVVPQPVTRDNSGALVQARDQIEVYFDSADRLYSTNVSTGQVSPNPTVVDLAFYQLHADRGTVNNTDDTVINPTRVDYIASRNMVVLTFAQNIDVLQANDTSFRLRVGTNEVKPLAPTTLNPSDPGSTFLTAQSLGTFSTQTSLNVREQIVNSAAFPLDFPGAPDTPGSREVDDDPQRGESHLLSDSPDTGVGLVVQQYNFNKVNQLGTDAFGQPIFNSISAAQEQRAREIFEIYANLAGIRFIETESSGWTIATANIDGVGGAIGVAGGGLARMDAAESWWDGPGPSDDNSKFSWIAVATHEIGHLLGLGHSSELPPGTNMGGAYSNVIYGGEAAWFTGSPVEPVLPGVASVTNVRYLFRPDSRDIDMYRFVVGSGKTGEFSAEIVAERLPDSSILDTVLTLYRENADGTREIISTNDDYFSEDSYLKLNLAPGVYYLGVAASGNRDFNPEITDSGLNGTSEGVYSLRTSFRPLEAASITDINGSTLDGDSDGLSGGVYNFWFQAAAPNGEQGTQRRTLFVDKSTGSAGGSGSRSAPFLTIQAAFAAAQPGDIVRLVPNGGLDGNVLTPRDNLAFEVGTGGLGNQALSDGSTMEVPKGVTVMVDAGVLFKMGRSAIGIGSTTSSGDRSRASLQVLGTPERSVLFTSYTDESLGVDTDILASTPLAGDWGGVMFRNALDRAEGRFDDELQGRFVNYVSFADMRYGGGQVSIDGQSTPVTPLHMVTARPTLAYNTITKSASAAVSANPNSFEETNFTTARYQAEVAFTPDYSRVGPDIYGNTLTGNSINGLFIRIETLPGQSTTAQTVSGRWDDTDIVHVIADTLTVDGTPGGAFMEQTPPSMGGINLASGGNVSGGNLVALNSYRYRMTFVDANGNEGVPSAPTLAFQVPAGANSIRLSNLPSAAAGFVARKIYRSDDGGVTYRLVAELDRSSTVQVDSAIQRNTTLSITTQVARAKLDASLTVDPGLVIKLQGGRIVAGVSAQVVAEGSETLPIVFTSRQDDRFGAGGTFDTNNDQTTTSPQPGDWGGLYFERVSSGSLDYATVSFGGGVTAVAGTFAGFNAIEVHQADVRITNSLIERNASGIGGIATANRQGSGFNTPAAIFVRGSQPIIVGNVIRNNNAPAISIDPNSLSGDSVKDNGRFTGLADRNAAITENKGPLLRGNALGGNSINGMVVRGGTLNTESVWDDTDMVHVVQSEIVVPDLFVFGGLRLQSSPNESLVVKFGTGAGLTSNGRPIDIDDRIGGTLQVIGTPGFPVILTSLADDSAGVGFDPDGRAQTDTNNNGSTTAPVAGSWRSLRIDEFSNDRNVVTTIELEPAQSTGAGVNSLPSVAQYLGILASSEKSSDDNSRLGFTISGVINNINDLDIYSFRGTAGSNVWFDIDRTNISLDSVLELIDSNGNIIAQSDNSFDESGGVLPLYFNPAAIDGRFVNSMQTGPFSPRNGGSGPASLTNTFADFYSTNPLDAGMRLVLPGATGSVNTYFVRVRSSNIDSRLIGVNRADLQSAGKVLDGKTEGQYQLQVRIRETNEFGGSSISLADVRYATNAIEVIGMPTHSPLVGEAVELPTNNNVIGNALDLGNLLNTDRAALSVGGDLNSLLDVDWYRFQVNQVSLQDSGLVQHLSAVIDVDYADGLGRANTSLWLFYDDQNGLGSGTNRGIRLVAFGTDSNVADDFAAPLRGSNVDDLSRGSAGVLDAFLGNIELPSGSYFLAITANEQASDYLAQYYRADAGGNPLTRVEPVNSIRKVIEDRFGGSTTTAVGPLQTAFVGGTTNTVPYNLSDVVLFVSQQAPGADQSELISINPLTGQQISLISRFPFVEDITVRGDGTIHGSRSPQTGIVNDANSGGILQVDAAGNATTTAVTATSGIQTFELDNSVTPPAVAQALTPGAGTTRAGRGMEFLGLTYPQIGSTQFLYGSASRVGTAIPPATKFTFSTFTGNKDAKNYIYKMDPTSLAAVSAPFNDRTDNARLQGAGTQVVERGYVDTSLDAGPVRNATSQTIVMADASSTTAPSLLSGDRVTLRTSDGLNHTFEWTAAQLSATLVADTLPQTSASPIGAPAPTNFYRDGMTFQLTAGANSATFEIDTDRVITNNYATQTAPATYDGYTFVVRDNPSGNQVTFEFDSNTTITAGNSPITFDAANSTQFQVSQAIINAIRNPLATAIVVGPGGLPWKASAFLLPGTNRISLTGDAQVNTFRETGNIRSPLTVSQLVNNFPVLTVGQTYDGSSFTITDRTGDLLTFEFDLNGAVTPGNVPITYTASSNQQFLTQAIDAAINNPVPTSVGIWDVQSFFVAGSNTLRILGDQLIAMVGSTATVINPISIPVEYGLKIGTSGNILVPIEEFYTNLDNIQFLPQPSTPGAMDELISAINGVPGLGITASAIGTRLVLAGATGANFTNTSPIAFNAPIGVGTPLFFNFNSSAATLNTTLLNAVRTFEPLAQFVTGNRIWLPETSSFVQATTNDRGDLPSRNAQLSVPQYGDVTGLAFAGDTMFGISDQGDLYQIGGALFNPDSSTNDGDFIETIYNTTTLQRVQFASLVAGPRNAESSLTFSTLSTGLSRILFGIDTSGVLYAFDTLGRPAHVFPDAQWFIQTGSTNPSGLAFSNLDVNLWHQSANRDTDAGHGVNISFDGDRRTQENGGNSLYFGFDNPNDALRQTGDWTGINNPIANFPGYDAARENTFDFAGGAKGSVISNLIDLSNYSPGDKPTLYFNYYLQTENANASDPANAPLMKDAFRIFASDPSGAWQLMGTNNSQYDATRMVGNRDELDYPFENDPLNALNRQVSELFDAGATFNGQTAPDNWRQARIDLSRFAGQKDLRIRFDFSTAGSFNVGTAGIELSAIPGSDIPIPVAQRRFTVGGQTFEFDFGLMIQIPSGARLTTGDQFEVDGVTYTFANNNVGNNVLFTANDTAEIIAARIVPKLTARGLIAVIDPLTPSRISVMNAVNSSPFVSASLPASFLVDTPGTGANQQVLVNRGMTAIQVRDAIRIAFARAFNAVGHTSNLQTIRVQDRSIILWNKAVTNRGPLLLSGSLQGDEYGEAYSGTTTTLGRGAQRAQNNRFEGVYVDDIVIGFAERGEMVTYQTNSTPVVTTFSKNPRHEPIPGSTTYAEIETGTYQVEVRRGATYGLGGTLFPDVALFQTFDTNDRNSQQLSLVAPRGSEIFDGQTFQLSNGVTIATYEYDDTSIVFGPRLGVAQGNVRVPFTSLDSAVLVAQSIRDAINSAESRAILDITAGVSDGTVTGTTYIGKASGSRIVNIHSTSSIATNNRGGGAFGVTRFATNAAPSSSGYVLHGIDTFKVNEAGDQNRERDQGLILISSNIIRDASGFGIVVDAGARVNATLIPLAGVLPHPGAARNLLQFNQTGLIPGPVIVNNLIYSAVVGGILFSGDQRSNTTVDAPVPFGRIINNTIVGLNGTGIGINVTENASPTLLNNIVASNSIGINVDGTSSTTVIGATLYKGNTTNTAGSIAGLGNTPQVLATNDPLFVNAPARNYYLAAGSLAIDSSADSLNDRQEMTTVRRPLGIADSPILAPDIDLTGQLRLDDPAVSNPNGTGANPFKDRGAYDRADFFGPVAIIQQPLDNDPDILDVDRSKTYIRLASGSLEFFSVLLFEAEGTGPDPLTVTDNSVALTENGRLLRPGVDYIFGYSPSSRTIRLTPLSGFWRADSVYEITLVNKSSFRLGIPSGGTIANGNQISFTAGATPFVLEFDTGDGVTNGAIPVLFQPSFTASMVAGALLKALSVSNLLSAGVRAYANAIDQILLSGLTNLSKTPALTSLTSVLIPAITDIAQNNLQANRPNSLTQFTIVMPEVGVDYGDAIKRSSSASNSQTLQVDNGARHAIFPSDIPLLALGQFVDADLDGKPSPAADGDDFSSAFTTSAGLPITIGSRGPTRLNFVSAPTVVVLGKKIIITDTVNRSVTYQFIDSTNTPPLVPGNVAVDLTGVTTAAGAASSLTTAIRNSILAGQITGIQAILDGSSVAIGGTSGHIVNLSDFTGITFIQKQASGSVDLVVPAVLTGLAQGQTLTIQDGSGNTVTFQIINSTAPVALIAGNVPILIDILAATQSTFTTAVGNAINDVITAGRLKLPTAVISATTGLITVNADDEDGVQFNGLFNARALPVPVVVSGNGNGYIDAWFDWNQDNDFDDVGEQVLTSEPFNSSSTFLISTPATALVGYTTARFRLSATGGAFTTGLTIGGEVEDHIIEVVAGVPPVAVNDPDPTKLAQYRVNEDLVLTVSTADGVLFNDTDVDTPAVDRRVFDEDPFLAGVQPVTTTQNGTLVLGLDGSFVYTPNADFFGTDTFSYRLTDPRLVSNNTATVIITVNPVNDLPFANPDIITISEDNIQTWAGVLFTGNDIQGITLPLPGVAIANEANATAGFPAQKLIVKSVNLVAAARTGESVSVTNNVISYTPGTNYNERINGPVLIRLEVEDDGVTGFPAVADFKSAFSTLTVNITAVNDSPLFNLAEVVPTVAPNAFTNTPTVNANGEEITVTANEDAPTQKLRIFKNIAAGPVLAEDELFGNAFPADKQPTDFIVTIRPQDTYLFTAAGLPKVNQIGGGIGELEFTLAPDANALALGPAIVTFQIDDKSGLGAIPNGPTGPLSKIHTVTINVRPVNDAPILVDDAKTFNEDFVQTWNQTDFTGNDLPGPSNENLQTLTIVNAELVDPMNPSNVIPPRSGESIAVTTVGPNTFVNYTPGTNYNLRIGGTVFVRLSVKDSLDPNDQGSVQTRTSILRITIDPVNDSPLFSLAAVAPTVAPNAFTNTPTVNANGEEITVTVNEDAPTQKMRIFTGIAAGPVLAEDELFGNAFPADKQPTDFIVTIRPQDTYLFTAAGLPKVNQIGGGIGELEYTLAADANSLALGPAIVTFQIDDKSGAASAPNGPTGNLSKIHTVTINVRPVNDAPILLDDAKTFNEDFVQSWNQTDFLVGDVTGPANENLQTLRIVNAVLVNSANVVVVARPGEGVSVTTVGPDTFINYTPGTNYNRLIASTVFVRLSIQDTLDTNDQGTVQTVSSILAITIDPVNDSPLFDLVAVPPTTTVPTTNPATGSMSLALTVEEDVATQKLAIFSGIAAGPALAFDELGNVVGLPAQPTNFIITVRPQDRFLFTAAGQPKVNLLAGGSGELEFTLAPDANTILGPVVITFQINDNGGPGAAPNGPTGPLSKTHTVTINVNPVNDAPQFTMSTNTFTTVEDTPLTRIPGFLTGIVPGPATAIDEVGQTVTITVAPADAVNGVSYFKVQPRITGTGDLEFQLNDDVNSRFSGSLNIAVTATDNGTPLIASTTKTLTITAADINDSPSFTLNKPVISIREDEETFAPVTTQTVITDFVRNLRRGPDTARDERGFEQDVAQVLSFETIVNSNPTLFTATGQPTIDTTTGNLIFHTAPDRSGTSVFVVRLTDSGRVGPPPNSNVSATATFTINIRSVNDAPEFSLPASRQTTADEDQGVVTVPGFAIGIRPGPATAIDESTQELNFIVRAENPSVFAVQPTIQADGTLVYQTARDVNDNTRDSNGALLSRRVFVSLRDNGPSTIPDINLSGEQTFTVNINPVNDPPIPSAHVVLGAEETRMTITAASIIAGLSPDAPGPLDEVVAGQRVRMTQIERTTDRGGVVTPIFVADQIISFNYNPPLNYVGDDIIRYVVTDDGVPQASATGTITIQLSPINDPPQFLVGSDITVQEDAPAFSAAWATAILAGPPSAIDEINGVPPLTPAQTVSFALTTNNDSLFSVLPAVSPTGVLTFTLSKDANGRAIVDVVAVDSGSGTLPNNNRSAVSRLTIVANPLNDAPGFNVIGNVSVEEDSARYTAPGIRDIVPAQGLNDTPATGADELGQSVSIFTSNNNNSLFSVQPTISAAGVLEFVPAQDAFGTAIVSVFARDNGANTPPNVNQSAAKSFTITLQQKNDAPVAVNDRYTTGEDTVLTVNAPGVIANDRDVDLPNDTITVSSSQTTSTLGAIVNVLPNGQFTYDSRNAAQLQRLVDGETAVDTFTYTLRDAIGLTSNLATVTITVSGSNDIPVAVNDNLSVPFGITELLNVLANDKDADNSIDPRTVEIGQLASHGTATAQPTGRIEYRPAPGFKGIDTFTYRVRDSLGALSNEALVTVTINTSPLAVADFARTNIGTPVVIDVLRNDSDPDGTLNRGSVTIASGPDVGSAAVQADGSIRYSPSAGFGGTATLQYSVLDNDGLASNLATVTIIVGGSIHQNPSNNLDVNGDGSISPIDVLILINDINFNGERRLPSTLPTPPFLDPNGNGSIDPLDVLLIINHINVSGNAGAGEGESSLAKLGYSQEIVRTPTKEEIVMGIQQSEYRSSDEGQIDLAVSAVAGESLRYGPALASASGDDESDDSLESYLASWISKPKRSESSLDSIFADEAWM